VAGVNRLYDCLSVGPVVGPYDGRCFCILPREYSGREGECMEICSFGNSCILENYQEARVIDPLDLKTAIDVLPLCKSGLNVSRFQLFWKAGESQDAGNASGEL